MKGSGVQMPEPFVLSLIKSYELYIIIVREGM